MCNNNQIYTEIYTDWPPIDLHQVLEIKFDLGSKDGLKFDDYPGFQPKITHPKHFTRQRST